MNEITFTATATFSTEAIKQFAKDRRWNGDETEEEFVQKFLQDKLSEIVGEPTVKRMKQRKEVELNQEISSYKQELATIITVQHD